MGPCMLYDAEMNVEKFNVKYNVKRNETAQNHVYNTKVMFKSDQVLTRASAKKCHKSVINDVSLSRYVDVITGSINNDCSFGVPADIAHIARKSF